MNDVNSTSSLSSSVPFPPDVVSAVTELSLVTDLRFAAEVTSTNALLIQPEYPVGTVYVTDYQCEGRGRRGRVWTAPPETSLMFSFKVTPGSGALPLERWGVVPLVTGTALIEAIYDTFPDVAAGLGLKWPNDLITDGSDGQTSRKVAGILVEMTTEPDPSVVIGCGINTDWRTVAVPDGVPAVSLAQLGGSSVDRWELFRTVITNLNRHLELLGSDPDGVVPRYARHCATLGKQVTAQTTPAPINGVATSLTPAGHLVIRTEAGKEVSVAAGDVVHLR